MRFVRPLRLAVATSCLLPALAAAQAPTATRGFEDSWFWGAKGGVAIFTTGVAGTTRVVAPSAGVEWLITRRNVGAYVSLDQAFFDESAGVYDASVTGSAREVKIGDARRYAAGVYFYPVQYGLVRPYAGLGLAIHVIQRADPQGTYASEAAQRAVLDAVREQSSRVSATFTAGAQAQLGRASVFGQASMMPTRNNFLINGGAHTYVVEAGVRYNLLSAIDSKSR